MLALCHICFCLILNFKPRLCFIDDININPPLDSNSIVVYNRLLAGMVVAQFLRVHCWRLVDSWLLTDVSQVIIMSLSTCASLGFPTQTRETRDAPVLEKWSQCCHASRDCPKIQFEDWPDDRTGDGNYFVSAESSHGVHKTYKRSLCHLPMPLDIVTAQGLWCLRYACHQLSLCDQYFHSTYRAPRPRIKNSDSLTCLLIWRPHNIGTGSMAKAQSKKISVAE
jgi:hypothetical protein